MKHEEEFQPVIGPAEVRRAQMILNRYKEGKANLERRVVDNEQWYKLRYYTAFAVKAFRIYLCMMVFACVNKACFIYLQAAGRALASTLLSMFREAAFRHARLAVTTALVLVLTLVWLMQRRSRRGHLV